MKRYSHHISEMVKLPLYSIFITHNLIFLKINLIKKVINLMRYSLNLKIFNISIKISNSLLIYYYLKIG